MIAALLAGALLSSSLPPPVIPATQTPAPQEVRASPEPAVELEDIIVTGRPLDAMIRDFVGEVAEPNRRRGLARWQDGVCVGAANLRRETAQYLIDRISTVAADVGLEPGGPGCTPNLMVVATADGGDLARALVGNRPRAFRMGGSGMDRGGVALRDFMETERPVRWWQLSVPVDSATGQRAIRLPGDCSGACMSPMDFAPTIRVFAVSRLKSQIVDVLFRTVVIVDVDEIAGLSALQLADYIAMVSLAQIDPDAEVGSYASILNVFETPETIGSLTNWDRAYLGGLYSAERGDANRRAGRNEVVNAIRREHGRLRAREVANEAEAAK